MRKQTKIAALVSAAALLAIGASMTSFAAWNLREDGQWEYLDRNGQPVYGEWHRGDTDASRMYLYYAGYDGVMLTDTVVPGDDGELYFVNSSGQRVIDRWEYIDEEDGQPEGYYYFNATTGKAVRADSGRTYASKSVRKSNSDATKGTFVFDETGVMQTGWVDNVYVNSSNTNKTFYCVQYGDDYDIEVEGDFNYVEGQALSGWAKMPVKDGDADTDGALDDFGYGWYYFKSTGRIGAGTESLSWLGTSGYYKFNTCGLLTKSVSYAGDGNTTATYSNAAVYTNDDGAALNGNGWVYNSGDEVWYYIVNIRKDNKIAQRGVKFNSDGQKTLKDGEADKAVIRVKSINNQLYAFDNSGTMITGDVEITADMINVMNDDKGVWNGISYHLLDKAGWYYFNEPENPAASVAGRMMKNVKVTTYDDDGEAHTRYYTKTGKAAVNEAYNNYLYGADGDLIVPDDGSNFMLVEVPTTGFSIHTSSTGTPTPIKPSEGATKYVLVNRNGVLIKNGTVNIDSETKVTVKDYVVQ